MWTRDLPLPLLTEGSMGPSLEKGSLGSVDVDTKSLIGGLARAGVWAWRAPSHFARQHWLTHCGS